jgi:hypothetical protein
MSHSLEIQKLFAVYLGGRAPKCYTELHDVVFVVAPTIEATYERLMDKWFGDPLRLHIDSWIMLDHVDGYRVVLNQQSSNQPEKLYFVNLGAYRPGEFTELHANLLLVGRDVTEIKQRAKQSLLQGAITVHTDDLFDVDDCLRIAEIDGYHVHLEFVGDTPPLVPNNGYHVIPKDVVQAYAASHGLAANTP